MKIPTVIAGLILVPFLQGCSDFSFIRRGARPVAGSGTIITETREVSDFDRVSVSGTGNLKLIQGDEELLTIVADDNFMPLIRSEVSGGHLRVGPRNVSLRPTQAIQYTLKLKTLTDLAVSGSLRTTANEIVTESLRTSVSGSGSATLQVSEELNARVSGSGSVKYYGSPKVTQRVSGSGTIRGLGER